MTGHPASDNRLPTGIWILGCVSLLMDLSSEIIHSLLPVYLMSVLGASAFLVGLVEGSAKATAQIVKVFSGALSDYLGKRKGLAVLGYGLGALAKPVFALAPGIGWILAARVTDRVGKGIRGAPRDALVADLVPVSLRGAAYGLRQSLDTIGAFLGPLLAVGLMLSWSNDYQAVFWVAVVPALLSVALLIVGVKEPDAPPARRRTNPVSRGSLRKLQRAYWMVVLVGALFTLARFSEAFLLLRAEQGGLAVTWLPLVLFVMNLTYSLSAYPFGRLSDRMSHGRLLMFGMLVLLVADLLLAMADHWAWTLGGVALWGIHMGMTQGLLATMVANTAPENLRGTAFGFFNLVSGVSLFVASVMAGTLWTWGGPRAPFLAGAVFCLITLLLIGFQRRLAPASAD